MPQIVTVRANPTDKKKQRMIMRVPYPLSLVPDNNGGFRGLPKGKLSKYSGAAPGSKKIIVSIKHGMSMDLDDEQGKILYEILTSYPEVVAKNRDQLDGRQRYYMENLHEIAIQEVDKDQRVFEVGSMIFAMSSAEQAKLYEAGYGLNADLVSSKMITSFLTKQVKENPSKVYDKIKDPQMEKRLFLSDLVKYGFFRKDGNKIYHGEGADAKLIGLDVPHAINWLNDSENTEYIAQLVKDLKTKKKQ